MMNQAHLTHEEIQTLPVKTSVRHVSVETSGPKPLDLKIFYLNQDQTVPSDKEFTGKILLSKANHDMIWEDGNLTVIKKL